MKKIIISMIVSFAVMVTGIVLIVLAAMQRNEPVMIVGIIAVTLSCCYDAVLFLILLRSWLIEKGA